SLGAELVELIHAPSGSGGSRTRRNPGQAGGPARGQRLNRTRSSWCSPVFGRIRLKRSKQVPAATTGEHHGRARECGTVLMFLPNLFTYLRVFASRRILGEACSFGERNLHRATFQMCLFVAVRGPESFPGRNCSYGARPWFRTGLSRHASMAVW